MRGATAARSIAGGVCLVMPGPVLRAIGGADAADPTVRWLARLLGARYLAQAAVGWAITGARAARVGVAIEAAHAASMVPFVVGSHRHRRTAVVSATVAGAIALLELRTGEHP
ncbi:hypothetical protein [Nocardioides sp. YIM 152315]|uniref:hypothetical protein n=1 Tax=Nocardioides sp. YIM 152315 TaxID=3031760 RepID=UPI0023DA55D5|nr:hypothetical protein [Nocardioides sp. YIM 152315]MDF1601945.1 hypothetical protein [Nocardioides sp. YIM 152315]